MERCPSGRRGALAARASPSRLALVASSGVAFVCFRFGQRQLAGQRLRLAAREGGDWDRVELGRETTGEPARAFELGPGHDALECCPPRHSRHRRPTPRHGRSSGCQPREHRGAASRAARPSSPGGGASSARLPSTRSRAPLPQRRRPVGRSTAGPSRTPRTPRARVRPGARSSRPTPSRAVSPSATPVAHCGPARTAQVHDGRILGGVNRCRCAVRPLRVTRDDAELGARVRRGVGFLAECSCGFRGRVRPTVAIARQDRREHLSSPRSSGSDAGRRDPGPDRDHLAGPPFGSGEPGGTNPGAQVEPGA